jgi:membrane fusion protein, multidrug efflux system
MKMKKTTLSQLLLSTVILASCGNKSVENNSIAPIAVITEQTSEITAHSDLNISGNVEGNTTVRLGFMVAGKINFIAAKEGQQINKGQLIASLESDNYQIAKDLATIQVNQITDEYQRLQFMHDKNSVSESDFSKVGFALQQAKMQQKLQAKNLSDTRLISPISGVLLKKMAEVGEITPVGTPILVISDITKVKVNAYIPENELHTIKIGQTAKVQVASLDKVYTGKVVEVGSSADPTSRAFTVKIEINNPTKEIRPGMIAEVLLETNNTFTALSVPAEAVIHGTDGENYVFVADATRQKAFKRKVSIGRLLENRIEILSGLEAGETIVTGGQQKLSDGSSIIITH